MLDISSRLWGLRLALGHGLLRLRSRPGRRSPSRRTATGHSPLRAVPRPHLCSLGSAGLARGSGLASAQNGTRQL